MLGVLLSFFLVDSLGRRPLLVWGSAGCAAALGALCIADWLALKAFLVAGMCAFIFAFRWAPGQAGGRAARVRARFACCGMPPVWRVVHVGLSPGPNDTCPLRAPSLQHLLGGGVLGAACGAVQHERQVAGSLSGHRRALPHRWEGWGVQAPACLHYMHSSRAALGGCHRCAQWQLRWHSSALSWCLSSG